MGRKEELPRKPVAKGSQGAHPLEDFVPPSKFQIAIALTTTLYKSPPEKIFPPEAISRSPFMYLVWLRAFSKDAKCEI